MAAGLIEVRRNSVNEVCRQALRRIDGHEDGSVVDETGFLRLPILHDTGLEPTYEWKMGVAGTTTTTTTAGVPE